MSSSDCIRRSSLCRGRKWLENESDSSVGVMIFGRSGPWSGEGRTRTSTVG